MAYENIIEYPRCGARSQNFSSAVLTKFMIRISKQFSCVFGYINMDWSERNRSLFGTLHRGGGLVG